MALPALVTGFGLASGAVGVLGTVMSTVGRVFLMNPIGLAVTAIAGLLSSIVTGADKCF